VAFQRPAARPALFSGGTPGGHGAGDATPPGAGEVSLELEGMVRQRNLGTGESRDFHDRIYLENTQLIDDALTHVAEELRLNERAAFPRDDQ
jgi:hypothetical protein